MTFINKITKSNVFNLFNSFWTSKWSVLFLVIFLLRFDSLQSKSALAIKFTCDILSLKTSVANLLNSEVSIYLSWLWLLSLCSIS